MPSIASEIVEVCIFRLVRNEAQYLLLKRSAEDKLYPGTWQIVTGMIEGGEQSVEAALREVQEETGLRLKRFWTAPTVASFYDPTHDRIQLIPMFAAEIAPGQEPKLSSEHQEHAWLSLEQARERLVWPSQRKALNIVQKYIVGRQQVSELTEIRLPASP
ncbi:MAG: NUDIX pyrophosphatase [Bacteroidota bacterium]